MTRLLGIVWLTVAVLCASCLSPTAEPSGAARFELFVLGRAQDGGLPHLGCDRECCESGRREGRRETPACLGIHDRETGRLALIEATPAIEEQVALLHQLTSSPLRGRTPVDAILITHAHIGHYLGLAQLGREVTSSQRLPVHVSSRMGEFLSAQAPWSQLVELEQVELHAFALGTRFEPLPGMSITATQVPHRDEFSDTVAFTIEGPNRRVLFVPDIDSWSRTAGLLETLIAEVDVAYLDATFYDGRELPGRDLREIPHPLMVDTMEMLEERATANPGRFRFIHLNHTNPAWHEPELERDLERRGFRIARVGERIEL